MARSKPKPDDPLAPLDPNLPEVSRCAAEAENQEHMRAARRAWSRIRDREPEREDARP